MRHPFQTMKGWHAQEAIRAKCFHPSGSFVEFRKEEVEQSIPNRFEHIVRKYSERLAVKTRRHALTYEELNQRANRISRAILARRGDGQEPVTLLLENDVEMISAILGALKAGKVYVPLDPSLPSNRNSYIIKDAQANLVLTNNKNLSLAKELFSNSNQLLNVDRIDSSLSAENPGLSLSPDTLAYILYTSGSTGQPKGVVQNHRNVLHFVLRHTNTIHLCSNDRQTLLYSCNVNGAARDIFSALLNGASLFPRNIKEEGLVHLADWLTQEEITIYCSVATVFRHFVNMLPEETEFSKLRLIKLGGEPVYKSDVELSKKHFPPGCILCSGLGSTETGTTATNYFVDRQSQVISNAVPIGYPAEDMEILLLDEEGKEVRGGDVGEIAVRSRYLFPGYWQKPDLTRAAFLPDPKGGKSHIYLTGDVGRVRPDGCLEHVGRKDFQMKVRGQRIEAAEIEMALCRLDTIKDAVVVAREDRRGDKHLVAYLVPAGKLVPGVNALRSILSKTLPDFMIPSAFVTLDALPVAPNGKVDRRALPAPDLVRPRLETTFVAPRTSVEEILARLWTEILRVERIGIYDNFFDLGGNSLLASQLISRLRDIFQMEVPLRTVFKTPSVAGLAESIETAAREEPGLQALPIAPRSKNRDLPLSFSQQRLWFLDQYEPNSSVYNIPTALRLKGSLNIAALEQSLNEIVGRHESLRTTFSMVDGEGVQVIAPTVEFSLAVVDLSNHSEGEKEQEAQRLVSEEAQSPFDLAKGPLFRSKLLRLDEDDYVLLLTMHHIVSDGWSMGLLYRELSVLYPIFLNGESFSLPEVPIQYADYAVWQREWLQGEVLDRQLSYWKKQLEGIPGVLNLPTDRPRPAVQSHRGARQSFVLPKDLTEQLKDLSCKEGVTLFMTLLATFQVLLYRYTGQEDIVVGSPIANRNRSEIEGLIGVFVNTLVLRSRFSGNPTFKELLSQVRETALAAYAHQDLPFEKVVEEIEPERSLKYTPLFQVLFNMADQEYSKLDLLGLTVERISSSQPESRFDLTLYVREESGQISFNLVYRVDLFNQPRMTCFLEQYKSLLEQILAGAEKPCGSYSLVTPESRFVLPDLGRVLPEPLQESVTALFSSWATRRPDQAAVSHGKRTWSYGELARQAETVARVLSTHGVKRGEVVAVYGPRSFGLICSVMGVLLSGGALLTVDPNLPDQRKHLMLREAGAKILLHIGIEEAQDSWLERESDLTILFVGAASGRCIVGKSLDLAMVVLPELAPDDPAYIFFTSGTTGVPKGVLGCHKGLSHFLHWQRETFAIGPQDRVAQLTTLSFDPVLRDIFLPLSSGAVLCLPEGTDRLGPDEILRWLETEQISVLHTVPTLAQSWLADGAAEVCLKRMRWVFFAGEPLTEKLVRRWRATFRESDGEIVNLYGPTETTLAKCFYRVPADMPSGVQPVGCPLPETQALVLAENQQPCGISEPGEIVLRTPFRTLGYINTPEENRQRFVKNPFGHDEKDLLYYTGDRGRYRPDGMLEILGRLDHQVKIRGVRVELDEVTAILAQHPAVTGCVVLARKNEQEQTDLVAYVVTSKPDRIKTSELRSFLINQLPSALVPAAFVFLEQLPLTPNGKIDRSALPAPSQNGAELEESFVAPRTPTEETLAGIWAELLRVEQVGLHDNFFDLGGHSLLATRILSKVLNTFQVELPVRSFFEVPTVAELAKLIEIMRWTSQGQQVPIENNDENEKGSL